MNFDRGQSSEYEYYVLKKSSGEGGIGLGGKEGGRERKGESVRRD